MSSKTDFVIEEERKLLEIITKIRQDYERAVQPYYDHLARIKGFKPMFITREEFESFKISPFDMPKAED